MIQILNTESCRSVLNTLEGVYCDFGLPKKINPLFSVSILYVFNPLFSVSILCVFNPLFSVSLLGVLNFLFSVSILFVFNHLFSTCCIICG